jgi:hypothetical protein
MSVSTRTFENGSERDDPMNPVCPSDEILRGILQNSDQETRSTEWLSHMITCRNCQDRISNWQQQSRFEALIQSAADYEIEYNRPPENSDISPVLDVTPGEPDGITNNYQDVPLRRIGNYELLALIGCCCETVTAPVLGQSRGPTSFLSGNEIDRKTGSSLHRSCG